MTRQSILRRFQKLLNRRRKKGKQTGETLFRASQRQLVWWRFKKHTLARVALFMLSILYLVAAFCEFLSPNDPLQRNAKYSSAPPMVIHFYDPQTGLQLRPFVYGTTQSRDPSSFRMVYLPDVMQKHPIKFFVHASSYKLWGVFPSDLHFFGIEGSPLFLLGTDNLGRCLLSRIFYAARISLTLGLLGVFISFILGLILGGISGYFGGRVDGVIQRTIDVFIAIPAIPLWMALAAALPKEWSQLQVYFAITIILSIMGWTTLARVVRGKLLSLREEDYVLAARLYNANEWRIITAHLLPAFTSYIIVSLTLAIPNMILGETALSFLNIGLRPPTISWGVMLQDAQNLITVAQTPWLLWPCAFVIITVLMFNFLGDGLRDAADPYGK
jgi:peptide/nickel transport system permease protein